MTNQEYLDSLDKDRRAIANNILANENAGMGVADVNKLPKSTWDRIMRDTEALYTGGKVSSPSATTEAIKAQRERDPNAFTEANSTTLKENIEETKKDAEEALTPYDEEKANEAKKTVDKIDYFNHSDQADKNSQTVKAGEEENEAIINEALADGQVDPSTLSGDQVEKNILKMKDLAGRSILTQDKDGNYSLAPDLTKKEFLEAVGGKKSNTTKNILTAISAGLALLGMPAPNLGKMYTSFTGENYDELYEEYLTQQTMLREGINSQFADAYGITVKGAASRDDVVNEMTDKDFQTADAANWSKELYRKLNELEKSGIIKNNQAASFQKVMNDLDKEQQMFIYDLQSKLEPAKHSELWKLLSKFTPDQLAQFGLKMKKADPNNSLTGEDLARLGLQTAQSIVGGLVSDKKTKSFISGAKLFGKSCSSAARR